MSKTVSMECLYVMLKDASNAVQLLQSNPKVCTLYPAVQAHGVHGDVLAAARLLRRERALRAVDPQAEPHRAREKIRKEQHLRAVVPPLTSHSSWYIADAS
jgi:hypothetical protein